MNRFKPGDKARVVKGGYFKIGDTVSVIQVHSEHNLTVKNDAGYRRLMYSSDLEPIEPVQEEESPIDLNDLLRTLLAAQYEAFTTGLRKSVVPVSHIIATFSEYGVKDIGEPF